MCTVCSYVPTSLQRLYPNDRNASINRRFMQRTLNASPGRHSHSPICHYRYNAYLYTYMYMLSCHKTIYVCPNFIARGVSAYFFGGMNGVVVLTPRNQAASSSMVCSPGLLCCCCSTVRTFLAGYPLRLTSSCSTLSKHLLTFLTWPTTRLKRRQSE